MFNLVCGMWLVVLSVVVMCIDLATREDQASINSRG